MRKPRNIILASASPRRRDILTSLGLDFRIDPSRVGEPVPQPGERPSGYAVRSARAKARAVAARHRSGLVVGADTIVVLRGDILGKPSDDREAAEMLRRLSGRWHQVITGICLIDCGPRRTRCACSLSRVHFRPLTRKEIEWYLDSGEQSDKAGAYAIQGRASLFIDRIEGCYFNIVGFPVYTFQSLCRRLGFQLTIAR